MDIILLEKHLYMPHTSTQKMEAVCSNPPKYWYPRTKLHDVITQATAIYTFYLSIYLSIYLSMVLQPFVGPWPLFQLLNPIQNR
jgi:hypothetical protein